MPAKLYVVPASHPCATVIGALDIKRVPYTTVEWVPAFHKVAQKALFGEMTVPGIVFENGHKVHGSRAILRHLEALVPDPPLYGDAAIADAEAWGNDVLQPLVRRLLWWALSEDPQAQLTYIADAKLRPPTPLALAKLTGAPLGWMQKRFNESTPGTVRADLAALPGHLDRIEAWIADGTLGGEPVNAADLQIAPSLRLLLTLDDLVPVIDGRPAGDFARKVFPRYPGHVAAGALPQI
ncbi:MAG: hypothetical protein QOF76_4335 [Solirubrobacteraceae bacterium]|nr:hypothetical protein [Solirubrobacteraceae bacterium]